MIRGIIHFIAGFLFGLLGYLLYQIYVADISELSCCSNVTIPENISIDFYAAMNIPQVKNDQFLTWLSDAERECNILKSETCNMLQFYDKRYQPVEFLKLEIIFDEYVGNAYENIKIDVENKIDPCKIVRKINREIVLEETDEKNKSSIKEFYDYKHSYLGRNSKYIYDIVKGTKPNIGKTILVHLGKDFEDMLNVIDYLSACEVRKCVEAPSQKNALFLKYWQFVNECKAYKNIVAASDNFYKMAKVQDVCILYASYLQDWLITMIDFRTDRLVFIVRSKIINK
ncbi:hypothetical protein EDEG_02626 [Edhazardia aedis USNM 41457]|uniref:Uncharacterized protein n=1 Tax=Edhazardia aedis (strain USNM 41457) TaxID=1003232 RepID=J9DNL4_EDHAE|nr:hypothetical protein EDEG_02626 [Edhazardia aedis USNM 41457]|eukprot:EJW02982.1 hypothetical protein EDEG_02626 [Edhazardia aedis USNM 41457]